MNSFEVWKYFTLNLYIMINEEFDIILFDGVCNLCNKAVLFIIGRDKEKKFCFVSLQSEKGKMLMKANGMEENSINSIVYMNRVGVFLQSKAVLNILYKMGYPWRMLYVFILLPRFVRDGIYTVITRNRYSIFGMKNECKIPDENIKGRFLQ